MDIFREPAKQEEVNKFQEMVGEKSHVDRRNFFFDLLRKMAVDQRTGVIGDIRQFKFMGHMVCFESFLILCNVSKNFVRGMLQAIKGGATTTPPDGRSLREVRAKPQVASVNSWLEWAYENLAEPLAETKLEEDESQTDHGAEPVTDEFFEWVLGVGHAPGAADFQEGRPQRWLPHCKPADLYQQYLAQFTSTEEQKEPASQTVFYSVFKECRGILRVRRSNQHAKCDDCVKYKLRRQKASTEATRDDIQSAYMEHLKGVWADRAVASHYADYSVWSTSPETSLPFEKRVLFIALDGMDECKYKLPRHTTLTKQWEAMWRPTLHNVLVVTYGLAESFWLGDCNLKKDSNNQCTILCSSNGCRKFVFPEAACCGRFCC